MLFSKILFKLIWYYSNETLKAASNLVHPTRWVGCRRLLRIGCTHQRAQLRQQVEPQHGHGLGLQLRQLGRVEVADGGQAQRMLLPAVVGLDEQPLEQVVGGGGVSGQALPQHRHLALAQPKHQEEILLFAHKTGLHLGEKQHESGIIFYFQRAFEKLHFFSLDFNQLKQQNSPV